MVNSPNRVYILAEANSDARIELMGVFSSPENAKAMRPDEVWENVTRTNSDGVEFTIHFSKANDYGFVQYVIYEAQIDYVFER